jgi:uncharacterized protein YqjF (DUF2071 family)
VQPPVFLTAQWRDLILLNYAIEPELLERYLPPGLEIDFWNERTYISLVAFRFQDTRLCGLAIPFHRNFPEVNLRFYVKRALPDGVRRGVVFLREVAPRRAVAYIARKFYGEKYLALPMRSTITRDERFAGLASHARYEWRLGKQQFAIEAASNAMPRCPEPDSLDEYIIEHYWAYSADPCESINCIEYEVEHPPWMIQTADLASFTGEAASLYGHELARVLARPPDSAFLADGSAVSVHRGTAVVWPRMVLSAEKELAANAHE